MLLGLVLHNELPVRMTERHRQDHPGRYRYCIDQSDQPCKMYGLEDFNTKHDYDQKNGWLIRPPNVKRLRNNIMAESGVLFILGHGRLKGRFSR